MIFWGSSYWRSDNCVLRCPCGRDDCPTNVSGPLLPGSTAREFEQPKAEEHASSSRATDWHRFRLGLCRFLHSRCSIPSWRRLKIALDRPNLWIPLSCNPAPLLGTIRSAWPHSRDSICAKDPSVSWTLAKLARPLCWSNSSPSPRAPSHHPPDISLKIRLRIHPFPMASIPVDSHATLSICRNSISTFLNDCYSDSGPSPLRRFCAIHDSHAPSIHHLLHLSNSCGSLPSILFALPALHRFPVFLKSRDNIFYSVQICCQSAKILNFIFTLRAAPKNRDHYFVQKKKNNIKKTNIFSILQKFYAAFAKISSTLTLGLFLQILLLPASATITTVEHEPNNENHISSSYTQSYRYGFCHHRTVVAVNVDFRSIRIYSLWKRTIQISTQKREWQFLVISSEA